MKYDFYNSTNWTPPGTPGVSKKSQKYFTNRSFELVRQNSAKIEIMLKNLKNDIVFLNVFQNFSTLGLNRASILISVLNTTY